MEQGPDIELLTTLTRKMGGLERRRLKFMNKTLGNRGLKGYMFRYIIALKKYPGSHQDFLAEFNSVDKSHVARTATKLEKLGYISRERLPENRRQYALRLTEAGEALCDDISAALSEWGQLITDGLSTEEVLLLTELLDKMIGNTGIK